MGCCVLTSVPISRPHSQPGGGKCGSRRAGEGGTCFRRPSASWKDLTLPPANKDPGEKREVCRRETLSRAGPRGIRYPSTEKAGNKELDIAEVARRSAPSGPWVPEGSPQRRGASQVRSPTTCTSDCTTVTAFNTVPVRLKNEWRG